MPQALSYELHKLTARLDRAAEGLLRAEAGVSYSRFLFLFAVAQAGGSQRDVARWLGLTEPATSRMTVVLVRDGLLEARREAGTGNRRQMHLTEEGIRLVDRCSRLLEERVTDLVRRSGVDSTAYQQSTRALLARLDDDERSGAHRDASQ